MANSRIVLRPSALSAPPGLSAYRSLIVVGGNSSSDVNFQAPYNRMTDAGIVNGHSTGGTDFRTASVNFDRMAANRLTAANGTTTNGSTAISCASGRFSQFDIGQSIAGTGIPANTTIVDVITTSSATLSQNATSTASTTVFTIGDTTHGTVTSAHDYIALLWQTSMKNYPYVRFSFDAPNIPAGARIVGVTMQFLYAIINDTSSTGAKGESVLFSPYPKSQMNVNVTTNSGAKTKILINTTQNFNVTPVGQAQSGGLPWTFTTVTAHVLTDYTTKKPTSRIITPADVADMSVVISMSNKVSEPEARIYQVYLNVDYNEAPSVSATAVGSLRTTTPQITWTYTDPEGDIQRHAVVRIWKTSDCSGAFDPNDPTTWTASPVYTSAGNGDFMTLANVTQNLGKFVTLSDLSSQSALTVPSHTLLSNTSYRVFVFVSDTTESVANARYNTLINSGAGGVNQGLDFTPLPDPVLSPWIMTRANAVAPAVGSLVVASRVNICDQAQATLETDGVADLGQWLFSLATTGSPPPLATTTTTAQVYRGIASGKMQAAAVSGTTIGIQHAAGFMWAAPGMLHTASIKVAQGQTTARRLATISIQFQDEFLNIISTVSGTPQWITAVANEYITLWVEAFAPADAVHCSVTVDIASVASEIFYWDCASLTPHQIGLADDGSFTDGPPSTTSGSFWKDNNGAGNTTTWVDDSFSTSWDSATVLTNTDPGKATQIACTNTANACNFQTWANVGVLGGKYLLSGWVKVTQCSSGTGSIKVGLAINDGTFLPASLQTISALPIGTWTQWSVQIDATGLTTAQSAKIIIESDFAGGPTSQTVEHDGIEFERLWAFAHGDFENGFTGTSIVDKAVSYGEANDWSADNTSTGTVTYDNSSVHGGTLAAKLNMPVGATPVTLWQAFSCEGQTSVTVNSFMTWSNLAASSLTLSFYDKGCQLISTVVVGSTRSGTQVAYLANNGTSISVPVNAHFAMVKLTNNGSLDGLAAAVMHIDDVAVVLTPGFVSMAPGVTTDGGWQMGASGVSSQFVERAPSASGPWTQLRSPGLTVAETQGTDVGGGGLLNGLRVPATYIASYLDYEWAPNQPGQPSQNFYRAHVSATDIITSPNSLNLSIFGQASDWWLIDPITPADSVKLQMKPNGMKITTDESMQILQPLGRNRKLVIADQIYGDTITLELITLTPADYLALQKQINKQLTLYLQSPDGEAWYVRPTKRQRERIWQGSYTTRVLRDYTFTLEQVDPTA